MSTVLRYFPTTGRARSCASRCYGSKTDPKRCGCVCGGALHGAGLGGALEAAPHIWLGTYRDGVLEVHERNRAGQFNQTRPGRKR